MLSFDNGNVILECFYRMIYARLLEKKIHDKSMNLHLESSIEITRDIVCAMWDNLCNIYILNEYVRDVSDSNRL